MRAVLQPRVMILQLNTASPWCILWSVAWRQIEHAAGDAVPCMGELQDCLEWRIKTYGVWPIFLFGRVSCTGVFPKLCSGFVLETVSWWTKPARKQHEWQGRCRHCIYIIEYV